MFSSARTTRARCARIFLYTAAIQLLAPSLDARAEAVPVRVVQTSAGWQLQRGGRPYFVKGAGGDGGREVLARSGGNSIRTWGADQTTLGTLDEAQRLGLTVTLGIWLGHKEHGFDYRDASAVRRQLEEARKTVRKFKDHPALLLWGLGNEAEMHGNDGPEFWRALEELAQMVHEVDPAHPVLTVVAEIGGGKLEKLRRYCPDLDVIGINTYGGGPSLAERYPAGNDERPYLITEFGPPGTWETETDSIGAVPEPTSTEKAKAYRATYEKSVLGAPGRCLGSYAFAWGTKIEGTATWNGMFLPDGTRLAAVDALAQLWSGAAPAHPVPELKKISLEGTAEGAAGAELHASVDAIESQGGPLSFAWTLSKELADLGEQGVGAPPPLVFPRAIVKNGGPQVAVKLPSESGLYRLSCTVRDRHGGAALGILSIRVRGKASRFQAPEAKLPLVIYPPPDRGEAYSATGWMGDVGAIALDFHSKDQPHAGSTCLRVDFRGTTGWGGVVWQSPANDWGTSPGGFDLSDATRLTFWARGAKGGESVTFGFGLIGIDKRYHDSGTGKSEVTLGKQWKQYQIDLAGRDLSCIKSGFYWTLQAAKQPLTFYLDDVRYR